MRELGDLSDITWYDVLGVLPGASAEEVRRQHDAKVRLLRPELVAGAPSPVVAATSRARAILDAAGRVLTDPGNRARYDEAAGLRHRGKLGFRVSTVRLTEHPLPVDGLVIAQSPGPAVQARRGSVLTVQVWHPQARR